MTKHTREKWADRIRQWRASGVSAEDFAADKDFRAASLRWAVSQLGTDTEVGATTGSTARAALRRRSARSPSAAAGRPSAAAPAFLPVRVRATRSSSTGQEMIVEVNGALIRVARGADMALLGDVVRTLQEVGQ